eukprot:TRINITY_DN6996_c0_g1_i1.p1 TRINITY_DN6996_c0_g1~~TRINITY_DN6996_c0_g1_i1.p1  ORF type:complete len:416 (-),score=131.69 TRINITY_DN6996_c0_g1_i1:965-2113(-)
MVNMGSAKLPSTMVSRDRPPASYSHAKPGAAATGALACAALLWYLDLVPFVAAAVVGTVCLLAVVLVINESRKYSKIMSNTAVDADMFSGSTPTLSDRLSVSLTHRITSGSISKSDPIELSATPSPYIDNLLNTSVLKGNDAQPLTIDPAADPPSVIVGSIRMGFGHHRIARAAATWGAGTGLATYFHDFLAIDSPEADLIKWMDYWYSTGSRLATEMGGPVEAAWGAATLSGGANALRQSELMGEALTALVASIPRDTPIVSSHSLVGIVAVAAGFKHVVNCVIDNHAQWFVVVPGALNLVQGPSNYMHLMKMGVPENELRLVGGWVPKDLVDNVEEDTQARLDRAKRRAPRRLLVSVVWYSSRVQYIVQKRVWSDGTAWK